jgi:hypothetical protein
LVLYAYVCVCSFSLHRESPNMILGDKPLISEVVLSQLFNACSTWPNMAWSLIDLGEGYHREASNIFLFTLNLPIR